MKKPLITFSSSRKLTLCLWLLLTAAVSALFFLPSEAVTVFASGTEGGGGSFFNLVSGWISWMFIVFPRYRVRVSLLAIPLMLLMLYTEGGRAFSVMLFSALAHELGHLTAIRFLGYRIRRIDVLPMSAIIVLPDGIPDRDELIIALSGPLASLLCALLGGLIFAVARDAFVLFFCVMNSVLCLFNLMPFKKSDGGKALYCAIASRNEKNAERICSVASYIALFVFISLAAICVVFSDANLGFLLLTLALVLQVNT